MVTSKLPDQSRSTRSGVQWKSAPGKTAQVTENSGISNIGRVLCKEGYITSTQLDEALEYQKIHQGRLGSILIRMGYIEEETIVNFLSRQHEFPAVIVGNVKVDSSVVELIPYQTAKKYMCFPLGTKDGQLVVTMTDPTDSAAVSELTSLLKRKPLLRVSTQRDVVDAYRKYYCIGEEEYQGFFGARDEPEEEVSFTHVEDFGSLVSEAIVDMELVESSGSADTSEKYSSGDAPIIKLVNGILFKAIDQGVSDIHIEPFEKLLQIRYRLDGALFKTMNLPVSIKNALISRLKIISSMNIAERRIPQDGRIKMQLGKRRTVDFRVSSLPTLFGESIVIRILNPDALNSDLSQMGFAPKTLKSLMRCVNRPYGLVLVTGPTGSGKTTTLYSILNLLNKDDIKILTAEDPVEFNFKGINQVNVKEKVGMTFAVALKAFLRQDPDVIMVGEIRDRETAEIAIKAAMTGHLVFSTLHTNDCPSTIGRLADIGIPTYMLASSVSMVLSQRLARRLCPKCKVVVRDISEEELLLAGFTGEELEGLTLYGPKGCPACNSAGYKGRVGLYELMEVTDSLADVISAGLSESELRVAAISEGMVTLRNAGLEKVREGVTSLDEVCKRTIINKSSTGDLLDDPEHEEYMENEVIIREGDRDRDIFRLIRGELWVIKQGKKIAEIREPGEYFGEMAAIGGTPRSATVVAGRRSLVHRYDGKRFSEVLGSNPELTRDLFEYLAGRLEHANEIIVRLVESRKNISRSASKKHC